MTGFFCFYTFGMKIAFELKNQTKKMKKLFIFVFFITTFGFGTQREKAFDVGEWFKFRIHYGLINAGYATLEVQESTRNNKKVFHAIGRGYTTGVSRFFFKVNDNYESYFDKETGKPYQFVRKIDEGGYTKNQEGFFNQSKNQVLVKDYKNKTENTYLFPENAQDIISAFYYLRNHPTIDKINIGDSVIIDMFFDNETTKFKLKYIGKQDIETKFGTIPTMVFRPLVQSGRIFKEQESLTVWISDDDNKLPVRIQASLVVGSIKADLEAFKGLKYSFKVKVNQ